MIEQIKTGDVIAIKGKSILSKAIKAFDDGPFSHVGIAYCTPLGVKIIEAVIPSGVLIHDLAKSYKGKDIVVYRYDESMGKQIAHAAIGFVGVDYEEEELLRAAAGKADDGDSKDGLVCSQLVAEAYLNGAEVALIPNKNGFHTPNSIIGGLDIICELKL